MSRRKFSSLTLFSAGKDAAGPGSCLGSWLGRGKTDTVGGPEELRSKAFV